jgi:hypothetical protein
MPDEQASLRDQVRLLMALAPMPDYSADAVVTSRVGKLLAQQADDRAELRRFEK